MKDLAKIRAKEEDGKSCLAAASLTSLSLLLDVEEGSDVLPASARRTLLAKVTSDLPYSVVRICSVGVEVRRSSVLEELVWLCASSLSASAVANLEGTSTTSAPTVAKRTSEEFCPPADMPTTCAEGTWIPSTSKGTSPAVAMLLPSVVPLPYKVCTLQAAGSDTTFAYRRWAMSWCPTFWSCRVIMGCSSKNDAAAAPSMTCWAVSMAVFAPDTRRRVSAGVLDPSFNMYRAKPMDPAAPAPSVIAGALGSRSSAAAPRSSFVYLYVSVSSSDWPWYFRWCHRACWTRAPGADGSPMSVSSDDKESSSTSVDQEMLARRKSPARGSRNKISCSPPHTKEKPTKGVMRGPSPWLLSRGRYSVVVVLAHPCRTFSGSSQPDEPLPPNV